MIQSMTGFGSGEVGTFRVEVRSLNQRFMDINVRLPYQLARVEMALRERLKERFQRGKFDVYVNLSGAGETRLNLDDGVAREIHASLLALKGALGMSGEVSLDEVLRWKDSFISEEVTYDEAHFMEAFAIAVEGLEEMRLKEGKALTSEIQGIADAIEARNTEITAKCPDVMGDCRAKFTEKLHILLAESDIDEGKILHEAAQIVEKADITEEVARIRSHIDQMRALLGNGASVGRKLDFILQELNREVNTIASKSSDPTILNNAIDMKAEIERAREQAQNIQ